MSSCHEGEGAAQFHIRDNQPVVGIQSTAGVTCGSGTIAAVTHIITVGILLGDVPNAPSVSVAVKVVIDPVHGNLARLEVFIDNLYALGVGQHDVIHIEAEHVADIVVTDGHITNTTETAQADGVSLQHGICGVVFTHLGEIRLIELQHVSWAPPAQVVAVLIASPVEGGSVVGDVGGFKIDRSVAGRRRGEGGISPAA